MSLNKVLLIGNLGNEPELRTTGTGQSVTTFNIATTRRWTNREGQAQEDTEWHRIVVWGRQAENCKEYLHKGRQVFLEGRLQTRQWEDKEGKKRYTTEVVAQNVQFLGGKRAEGDAPTTPAASPNFEQEAAPATTADSSSSGGDDIPF